ncbi:MAG: phospho-N-acetylmuramoyl-pentapeptide-transferase, partial [Gemmatimonadota bacterium]
MLFDLLFPLADRHIIFNVFQYISFRSAGAMVTSLLLTFLVGPPVIRWLKTRGWGQVVRLDGPSAHFQKAGTPTMGGLIIVSSVLLSTLLWARLDNYYVLIAAASTAWFGAIGFMDDYLKIVRHEPRGLVARYKLFWQLAAGLTLGVFLLLFPLSSRTPCLTMMP